MPKTVRQTIPSVRGPRPEAETLYAISDCATACGLAHALVK
jgi:hypothetical protein